jgi:hypothetical protein
MGFLPSLKLFVYCEKSNRVALNAKLFNMTQNSNCSHFNNTTATCLFAASREDVTKIIPQEHQ